MPARKTIQIRLVVETANRILRDSDEDRREGREGIIVFVESMLHNANAYAGFNYIGGYREGMDETRRFYYVKS